MDRDFDNMGTEQKSRESSSIYGAETAVMESAAKTLIRLLTARDAQAEEDLMSAEGDGSYEHISLRIKSEESMRDKCRRKGLPETPESALDMIHDAIGIRIVCRFTDDIWKMRERIRALEGCEVTEEKDYIHTAKPNGYRSYHMIVASPTGWGEGVSTRSHYYTEIQLRTIAMDSWAALEHEMRYKKGLQMQEMIGVELKRVADELAACDVSMQTIRDLIREG